MNRLYLLSWYYQGQDGESKVRGFFGKLREGIENGKKFPFDCPSEVGLVHCKRDEHWCVGVLVMRGTSGDDSLEQTNKLLKWFDECEAEYAGTDRTGIPAVAATVQGTLQAQFGSHYTCIEVFDPLSIVPGDKDREIESKTLSLDNLNPEDKAMAAELISLGDNDPDVRYKAYKVLDQKRYEDDALLSGISRIEAEIPSDDVVTRVRLYCGLGVWLGGNIYTLPKGIELIRHAIELSTNMALPHALVGTLLMGDSSNYYLEQPGSSGLSQKELELISRDLHDQAQKELELAIRLNPNDPTPYYVFYNSQFLDFSQLKNQYLQGVQRDKTHSLEFGGKHWSFAIKAAKFGQGNEATSAFLRAMIVSPQEYCEGPGSVRPQGGLALSCWQTAKQQMGSYQGDIGKIDALWLVGQIVESQTAKSPKLNIPDENQLIPEAQPKTPSSDKALTSSSGKTPKRSSALIRWILVLGILGLSIGLSLFLFAKPSATFIPLTPTATTIPLTPTATTPVGLKPGHWEGVQPFISFDVTNEGDIVNFILNAPFLSSTCNITIEKIEVVDKKFLVDAKTASEKEASIGIFVIQGTFDGETATGTHKIEFCGRTISFYPEEKTWKAEWKDTSSLPATVIAKSTVVVTKPIPTSEPSQTPVQTNTAVTYLSQFQPTIIELPFGEYSVGKFAFTSPYPEDPVREGDPIVVHGVEYPYGIFAHAPSRLVYEIGAGNFEQLSAMLGVVEWINNGIGCGDGANFVVLLDGKEIYRSDRLYGESEPVEILLPIAGGDELTLIAENGGSDNMDCDWAAWGDPRLR